MAGSIFGMARARAGASTSIANDVFGRRWRTSALVRISSDSDRTADFKTVKALNLTIQP
jgi:hypothetical protein